MVIGTSCITSFVARPHRHYLYRLGHKLHHLRAVLQRFSTTLLIENLIGSIVLTACSMLRYPCQVVCAALATIRGWESHWPPRSVACSAIYSRMLRCRVQISAHTRCRGTSALSLAAECSWRRQ